MAEYNEFLKSDGPITLTQINVNDTTSSNKAYFESNPDKFKINADGSVDFRGEETGGDWVALPDSTSKATADLSKVDPNLLKEVADLSFLAQNTGVKSSDMNAAYMALGLDPNDPMVHVKKDVILREAGYNPGSNKDFYGNNTTDDISAQILYERHQQQPTEQEIRDAGLDPDKVSTVNSNTANQLYLKEQLEKQGIESNSKFIKASDLRVTRDSYNQTKERVEDIIKSQSRNSYWDNKMSDTGMSLDDLQLDITEWDLIKKQAKVGGSSPGTGGGGFGGSYTPTTGGGSTSPYFGGDDSGVYGVGTGFTSTPTYTSPGTIYPEGVTGLSEVPIQTFNNNLNLQQQQFETRAEEQSKFYQPQTLAEKEAAGTAPAFENVMYRNRFGMTMYVQHINGQPSQPIPPGYFRVDQFGQAATPIVTGVSSTAANKGGLMGYAPGGVVQQQRQNPFSPELQAKIKEFETSPAMVEGRQALQKLQQSIFQQLGMSPTQQPTQEQMDKFNEMFNTASANDPAIQAMNTAGTEFQQFMQNNPEYQSLQQQQAQQGQQVLQGRMANPQQVNPSNMTAAEQEEFMKQEMAKRGNLSSEQMANAQNAFNVAQANATSEQMKQAMPRPSPVAGQNRMQSQPQPQPQQFQTGMTSNFSSSPNQGPQSCFDPGSYTSPSVNTGPSYQTCCVPGYQTQNSTATGDTTPGIESNTNTGVNNQNQAPDVVYKQPEPIPENTGTGTNTGGTDGTGTGGTDGTGTGGTGTGMPGTVTLDEAGLAQAQQNLVAQATAAPGGAVAAAPVSYINPETSGAVIESTAGQALPTAPMVTGDQLAQVDSATVANVPQTVDAAQVDANLATDAITGVVNKTEAVTSEGPTKTIEAAQADGSSVSGLTAAQGESVDVTGAPTRKVEEGEMITGTGVDQTKVGEAFGTGEVQAASVQDELTGLMQQFEGGNTPPWAAGAMRNATAMLAARGLSASSMAGQAVIQAAMESALPIAQIDASNKQEVALFKAQKRAEFLQQDFDQAFQAKVANAAKVSEIANMNFTAEQQIALENSKAANTMALQNLSNEQALVMAEAAALSQLDLANLSNNQQAAVQNAQNFLQIDMANLANEQQTALFKSQSLQNSILSDQAAANAAQQFNASSINQTNQFFANLASSINQFNAAQMNAMKQFNADEANSMLEFNASMQNQREMFNAQNYLVVAQANAQWRQNVATINSAAANESNMDYAQTVNGLTLKVLDQIWQRERDIMDYTFTQSENSADRALSILLGDKQLDAIQKQLDATEQEALGGLLTKIFFTSDTSEPYSTDTDEEE